MSNKKTKQDYETMRQQAVSTAVDSKILDQGALQIDIATRNVDVLNRYMDTRLELKRELLELVKDTKKNGMTEEKQKRIYEIMKLLESQEVPKVQKNQVIETQNIDATVLEIKQSNIEFAKKYDIDLSNPYMSSLSNYDRRLLEEELSSKFDLLKLDKYDYAFAAAVGLLCGAIDAILIGTASNDKNEMGKLAQKTDEAFDKMVMKYAKLCGWTGPKVSSNGTSNDSLKSAIAFLERNNPVNYDQRLSSDTNSVIQGMTPKNHHLLSLSHSPLGLLFAVIDLMTNKATFFDPGTGKICRIAGNWAKGASDSGKDQIGSVAEAIARWFGHLVSDVAGNSGSEGRGMGIPTGVQSILQTFRFGKIPLGDDSYGTIAEAVQKMFENGYDFRFNFATAIPNVILEVLIRTYWMMKQYFYYGKSFKESIPFGKSRELHRMLLIATASFSTVDVTHAIVKGAVNENPIATLNSLNYIGLANFGYELFVNFKLEHAHNEKIREIMETEIRQKHIELINSGSILE